MCNVRAHIALEAREDLQFFEQPESHDNLRSLESRDGRPVPRGRGGSPTRPALWGGGGSPPRPVKMIKTAGKLRGKINTRISTFPIE